MKIRLNKVQKELNVGLPTIVEYLQKKGFHEVEESPNTVITEEQYALLIKEFSQDKSLRIESDRFIQERQNKERKGSIAIEGYEPAAEPEKEEPVEKPAPVEQPQQPVEKKIEKSVEEIKTEIPAEEAPRIKTVGKIDLDEVGRPKPVQPSAPAKEEPAPAKPAPAEEEKPRETIVPVKKEEPAPIVQPQARKEEPVAPQAAKPERPAQPEKPQEPVAKVQETKPAEAPAKPQEQPAPVAPKAETPKAEVPQAEAPKAETPADKPQEKKEDEIFTLNRPEYAPKFNVVGQIDLDAINQSTRPKKKSKEEKRKDREEKEKQRQEQKQQMKDAIIKEIRSDVPARDDSDAAKKKKKRSRIVGSKERVDINAVNTVKTTTPTYSHERPAQQGGNGAPGRPSGGNGGGSNGGRGGKGKKGSNRYEVNDEDVSKQVKETMAKMTKVKGKASKYRKEKRELAMERQQEREEMEMSESKIIKITEFVTANELATMMNVPVTKVIATCMSIGIMVSINQRLDAETINLVAEEFGFETEYVSAEVAQVVAEEKDRDEDLEPRAPIVTVMGHVDHGKTSLLDYIRKSNVIAGEAGGITQHIGAYNVRLDNGKHITFLDTPGHEAFTAMRARGAKVTDIAIIIVAADDNVMPQTKEAINHAVAAGVPMVFAINKIDKPGADPEKIKEELANMNFLVEDWGGKYQSQDISAKKGIGVAELMEKVLLEAEMLDLKANPNRRAVGSIIESSLDKGRGYVATVLVSNGTLKPGDILVAGTHWGKIKAMFNERNQRMTQALPAEPALILGLNGAPQAGDTFNVVESEREAREITTKREQLQREMGLRTQKMLTLDEVGRRIALGTFQELNVIVKGDVDGSIEALSDSLIKLSTDHIQVNVIHKAVGQISESDVSLAAASSAIIIGFQVRPSLTARKFAEQEGVDIRLYSIIYDAIQEVKSAMEGLLAPVIKEEVTSTIEVREVFHISKVGTVAGAMVREGKVKRTDHARLVRDGIVIYTGDILALKRFKDDVKEVAVNFECGISLVNYDDIKVGDIIETFQQVEVKQTL